VPFQSPFVASPEYFLRQFPAVLISHYPLQFLHDQTWYCAVVCKYFSTVVNRHSCLSARFQSKWLPSFRKERPSRRYSTPNCIVSEIGAPTFSHLILEEGLALVSPLFGDGWLPRDVGGIAGGPELG